MDDHTYLRLNHNVQNLPLVDISSLQVQIQEHDYGIRQSNSDVKAKVYQCCNCDLVYQSRSGLYKHNRKEHGGTSNSTRKSTVKCPTCEVVFNYTFQLRDHVITEHEVKIEEENLQFENMSDFNSWKMKTEHENNVRFINDTGTHKSDNDTIKMQYFRCNRTGIYRKFVDKNVQDENANVIRKAKNKKQLKCQGSSKIGYHCTALIVMREKEGKILVTYYKTHFGHEIELAHINLSSIDKEEIAGQLHEGLSIDKILDKVRDSVTEVSNLERIHLITRKQIQRIEECYGLKLNIERDKNDLTSVNLWIAEKEKQGSSPVIYHKKQGEGLNKEDFGLALMTEAQAAMLKKFGGNIICMNATHKTNPYDFLLVTIMIVDEFGEGYPIAFYYTNHETKTALMEFIIAVKDKTGEIHCCVFMSDDAGQYFAAWVEVMGGNPKKLLCTWHVDRAWRNNLCLIKVSEKKVLAYKTLKWLQTEIQEDVFLKRLEEVKNKFLNDEDLVEFAKYFITYYAYRIEEWAYCFRVFCNINTNMYLEALHRVIKYVYARGLQIRRLDRSIHLLLKVVRDKGFDRIKKLTTGKNTSKLKDIDERHQKALLIPFATISQVSSHWLVSSQQNFKSVYTVTENHELPDNHLCCLRCVKCNKCVHSYSCSCTDHLIKGYLCKHIHAVCLFRNQDTVNCENSSTFLRDNVNQNEEIMLHLRNFTHAKKETDLERLKKKHDSTLTRMKILIKKSSDVNKLELINPYLTSMENILTMTDTEVKKARETNSVIRSSSNKKKFEQQPRFFSTRKKRRRNSDSLARPHYLEEDDLKDFLGDCAIQTSIDGL